MKPCWLVFVLNCHKRTRAKPAMMRRGQARETQKRSVNALKLCSHGKYCRWDFCAEFSSELKRDFKSLVYWLEVILLAISKHIWFRSWLRFDCARMRRQHESRPEKPLKEILTHAFYARIAGAQYRNQIAVKLPIKSQQKLLVFCRGNLKSQ